MQAQEKLKIPAELKAAIQVLVDKGIFAFSVASLSADVSAEYNEFLKALDIVKKYVSEEEGD